MMLNSLFKKTADTAKKSLEVVVKYHQKFAEKIHSLPESYVSHINNIFVLILSYGISSFLIYPEFRFYIFLKEIFSLLCTYGAIFFWFVDRIDGETPFRIAVGATACTSPVLFINNPSMVALIGLLLVIALEFVIFEYIRGCNLFSGLIPVYIICENEDDVEKIRGFFNTYKILELIVLTDQKNSKYSSLRSINDMRNWFKKINYIPFYPSPRKLLYFGKTSHDNFAELLELSADYAIPLFKISLNTVGGAHGISPVSFYDLEMSIVAQSDKTAFIAAFKNKRVWICYDGRGSVLDLICIMALANSIDLTIFCETEGLMMETECELSHRCPGKNYKIKISDISLFAIQGTKPDVLIYNMPIKSFHSGEENLKETVVKNVIDTHHLTNFAYSNKISDVFILSSTRALDTSSWVGATLRLGELFAQFADSQSRKRYTKFRVIRIPDEITDEAGIKGRILSSIFRSGCIDMDFPDTELAALCHKKDITPALVKTITMLMKSNDIASSAYTIVNKRKMIFDDFIKNICNLFCLQKDKDVRINYNCKTETMKLDEYCNVVEPIEKTSIMNVSCTRFQCTNPAKYECIWTMEEINAMSARELISTVFQDLNEKIST